MLEKYKRKNDFKKHINTHGCLQEELSDEKSVKCVSKEESVAHLLLLTHDLWDAYRHGDGDRVFLGVKFAFLQLFTTTHMKYRLWLWRMLAYEAILPTAEAFEYKWNVSANLVGEKSNNIPDDNVIEICVKELKDLLHAQGANVSFHSAQVACASMKYIRNLKSSIKDFTDVRSHSGHRSEIDKTNDVVKIANEVYSRSDSQILTQRFISKIKPPDLYAWCNEQAKLMSAVKFKK